MTQAKQKKGIESLQLVNVAVSVMDLERAIAWYSDKLGFTLKLGLEIARQLGKLGYRIIIGARSIERGTSAVETLKNGCNQSYIKFIVYQKRCRR